MSAHSRLVAMLDDPDCGGDLLLVGVALLALVDLGRHDLRHTEAMGAAVWGTPSAAWWVQEAICRDARTYEPEQVWHAEALCEAPMVRRSGACGKSAGSERVIVDYATGRWRYVRACSRHRDWLRGVYTANRAQAPHPDRPFGGAPLPAANHGGVLARHFPEFDWPTLWRRFHPRWVEHPEEEPWPAPTLTLLVGDDAGDGAHGRRPVLSLATGGAS